MSLTVIIVMLYILIEIALFITIGQIAIDTIRELEKNGFEPNEDKKPHKINWGKLLLLFAPIYNAILLFQCWQYPILIREQLYCLFIDSGDYK